MTPIGDVEIELVFRVAVRGRMRDLAELVRGLEGANTFLLCTAKVERKSEEAEAKGCTVKIGSLQP